jgi:hypothetical protein
MHGEGEERLPTRTATLFPASTPACRVVVAAAAAATFIVLAAPTQASAAELR